MRTIFYFLFYFLSLLSISAIPCPNPLSNGPFLGGICDLIPNTQVTHTFTTVSPILILDLNNTLIDCRGQSGIVFYSELLSNVTIQNGGFINCVKNITTPNDGGAAIYSNVDSLTLINFTCFNSYVKCTNASACLNAEKGGCIYSSSNSTVQIFNSTFFNCSASVGGAIHNNNILSITNTIFQNCSSRLGGAIHNNKILSITNSIFSNCSSSLNGGAIYSPVRSLSIYNSTFENCFASSNAGAIYSYLENFTVYNSIFRNCSAGAGGAIYSSLSNLSIYNSIFENCFTSSNGGAIYSLSLNFSIQDSSFKNCFAPSNGGAIYMNYDTNINNCTFHSCTSYIDGGAINSNTGNLLISNSNFHSCSSIGAGGSVVTNANLTIFKSAFTNSISNFGGAIKGFNIFADSIIFNNCTARNTGGAIHAMSIIVTVSNSFYYNCSSAIEAGAIYLTGTTQLYNNTFERCSSNDGGAISNSGFLTVLASFFKNCYSSNIGGTIASTNLELYITDSSFSNCSSTNGGAIRSTSRVNLINSNFSLCSTNMAGGAVWINRNSVFHSIKNCNFNDNIVYNSGGGAVYTYSNFGGLIFEDNTVNNCNATIGGGGAISMSYGNLIVRRSSFNNCNSGNNGGAISSNAKTDISNSSFKNCRSQLGGAITLFSSINVNGNSSIENSIFISNQATLYGGAINIISNDYTPSLTVTSCNFISNYAVNGSVFYTQSNLDISCSNFYYNIADYNTIIDITKWGSVNLIDSSFLDNFARNDIFIYLEESAGTVYFRYNYYLGNFPAYIGSIFERVFSSISSIPTCVPNITDFLAGYVLNNPNQVNTNTTLEHTSLTSGIGTSISTTSLSSSSLNSNNPSSASTSNTNVIDPSRYYVVDDMIDDYIDTFLDIYFNSDTTFVIPNDLDGPLVSTTGTIYLEGDIILDLSNYAISEDTVLQLFNQKPEGTQGEIIVGGVTCFKGQWGSTGEIFFINTCTSKGSSLHLWK